MAPSKLEQEDHSRDAAFNKAMHKDSSKAEGGFRAMMKKDKAAQKAAVEEYFKHWDNKAAKDETPEMREVCSGPSYLHMPHTDRLLSQARRAEYATLTRQYGLKSPRNFLHMLINTVATTTSEQICTSMVGDSHSTSAASRTVRVSTKPLLATNTTSPRRLVSRMETKSSTLAVVLVVRLEKSQSSQAHTSLA